MCTPKKAKTEICMPTSPLPPATNSEPAPDVFERLLQCSGLLTAKELARIVNLIPHFRIETNVRFRGKDVADWLRQKAPLREQSFLYRDPIGCFVPE
jgi:hypothetical protein